jgi:hypothetical protein
MSKYIPQLNETNFVYPNFEISEYDVDIIHDLKENSVSGQINIFSATTITSSGITFQLDWIWTKNNAEPFINNSGEINLVSIHLLAEGQNYYKPWRCVYFVSDSTINQTSYAYTTTFTVTPLLMGLSTFVSGTYYFEIRFIGKKAIYPVCETLSITVT